MNKGHLTLSYHPRSPGSQRESQGLRCAGGGGLSRSLAGATAEWPRPKKNDHGWKPSFKVPRRPYIILLCFFSPSS